jgi:Fe-S-cluster-containing dehydrogenase component
MKVFVFDSRLCNGCRNCQVSCKDEHCGNDWMPYARPQPETGQFWFKLNERVRGTTPKVKVNYFPMMCMHCDGAPCIGACPNKAISQRKDGLVWIDPTKCTGSQMCVDACPYGAIYFNQGLKLAQKCTGCAHLLDRGYPINTPRCVDSCITGALKFGEEGDFKDVIAKAEALPADFGPTPKVRVFYLNLPKKFVAGTVFDPGPMEVVIGATCTLSGDASATTTTDAFGDFWFEGLKVGKYSLKIEAAGRSKTIADISTVKDVNLGDIPLT